MCQPGRPRPQGLSQPGNDGVGGFPQHEIHRVALERRHLDPRPGDHVVDRPARQAAIFRIAAHVEQHMAVGGVGVTVGDQPLDHGDHRTDIVGGARLVRRTQIPEADRAIRQCSISS